MENITLPLSKSILNRCLVLSAISGTQPNYLPPVMQLPNDVAVMNRLLFENNTNIFNVEDAGTVFRFLIAYLAITEGTHLLYGTPKLNTRPIKPLLTALTALGAEIMYIEKPDEPPLRINGKKLHGGEITLDASSSSQFVSALMLIAPTFSGGLKINLINATSFPYINISKACLGYFGIESSVSKNIIEVKYTPEFTVNGSVFNAIETDWSSAAFWYALCAVTNRSFRFNHLTINSVQGDIVCMELFRDIGVETLFVENEIQIECNNQVQNNLEFDLTDCPDIAPALVVACALKNIDAKFYGLYTLQHKESNRAEALQTELRKFDIDFIQNENYWLLLSNSVVLPLSPSQLLSGHCQLSTYNDHRLAMAFACFKALNNKIEIENPDCVKKSYPMFWEEFDKVFGFSE